MLTADHWRRIERLFESVENAPAEDRDRLVYESGEDDSIRWEVLKMLNASAASGLLDVNLRARPTSVYSPGDLLAGGRFRIENLIAEGGMGEVYRATDTELQTQVALKTIHRVLAGDHLAVERFKQEVQLARSINHPNVCRIFDLEKQPSRTGGEDQFFLTMELLEGETLRAFLDREKQIDRKRAFAIVEPVLDALSASHDRGVLHRDLKPSNIHLAKSGKKNGGGDPRVVVTDFGLATSPLTSSSGKTISAGTPAYMAPEQFQHETAGPATDTYAVGVLLYEMIAGRQPFTGKTTAEIHEQKKLNQAIPLRELAPTISPRWESAIHRAIQADPARRFASASDFLAAIRPRRRVFAGWGAAVAAALALVAGAAWYGSQPTTHAPLASRKLTTDSGYSMEPAISKDGQFVVYTSDRAANGVRSLWRIDLRDGTPTQLTFDQVDSHGPHLSPDGKQIVFRSERDGGGLYIMPNQSAAPAQRIASGGLRPRFSPDGSWILFVAAPVTASQLPQVYAVRSQGGNPIQISAGFSDAHNPIWSEDGKYVLFCGTKTPGVVSEEHDWWTIPFLTGGIARKTGVLPALAKLAAAGLANTANRLNEDLWEWRNGYVYYGSPTGDASSLWRLRFTPTTRDLPAPPEQLTFGTGYDSQPSIGNGKIVYASSISNIDVWMLPLNANAGTPNGPPQRVTDNTDYEVSPTADPSGRSLVFTKTLGPRRELRFLDWQTERDSKSWSAPDEVADHPLWSRDGQWVAYRRYMKPKVPIYIKNRAGENRQICPDCGSPTDWSPDQRYMLYEPGSVIAFVGRLEIATGEWTEWIQHPRQSLRNAIYSPDGKWIAFQAETSRNDRRIFIARDEKQDSDRDWIGIDSSDQGPVDLLPSWSPDGNLLYYLSSRDGFRCIWAQRLDPATKRLLGAPFPVQHFHRSRRTLLRIVAARAPQIGFRVYRDRAFFSMDEVTGNLWLADLPR